MSEMNLDQARFNMIEQQIRPWDVLDQKVLDVIESAAARAASEALSAVDPHRVAAGKVPYEEVVQIVPAERRLEAPFVGFGSREE